ncbi:FAD-dependent monooxygenase [Nocardia sp. NPDC003482]
MRVLIIGAGIGGLTTAAALRRHGIDAEIHEAAPEFRDTGTGLGILSNATKVLRALDIDLTTTGRVTRKFTIHRSDGKQLRALPFEDMSRELGSPAVTLARNDVMTALRAAIGDTPLHLGSRLISYRQDDGVTAEFADGRTARGDVLIGADGIRSVVRAQQTGPEPVREYGYVCWLAVVPFTHPNVEAGAARHYWGRGQRFGLMDIGGGRAYWWGTKNVPPDIARDYTGGKEGIVTAFDGWADEVVAVIAETPPDAIVSVPAQDRNFLDQWGTGRVTLVGDAAHAMLTSLSQGAGSSIEDGYVLAHHLATTPDPTTALRTYENTRRPRARLLVTASRQLSRIEQIHNPLAAATRTAILRYTPMQILRSRNIEPMRFDLPTTPVEV